jgi:MFS family permease
MKKRIASSAMAFIVLMGIVSLLSDMTHEGARSIYGAFLSMTGASAAVIGFVSGFGELLGNSLIFLTGWWADKTKKYWMFTIIGYSINLLAIPALALVPKHGWILACGLLFVERIGRAIRKPSKSTLVSFASKEIGEGKTFAILEFMDQIGAFLGPVLLFLILLIQGQDQDFAIYRTLFLFLGIPAGLTLVVLLYTKKIYPNPSSFEKEKPVKKPFELKTTFLLYMIGIAFFAFGFIDFPIITLHLMNQPYILFNTLPLLYALAMLVDAFSALFFGWYFDRYGYRVLIISTLLSAGFAYLIFNANSIIMVLSGVILWGIGMGAQETILKATVASLIPKSNRSFGFGIFEVGFGLFWFLGSWLLGYLYDVNIVLMISLSVMSQLFAIPFFWLMIINNKQVQT